jgi:hypothetical protein
MIDMYMIDKSGKEFKSMESKYTRKKGRNNGIEKGKKKGKDITKVLY